jgi:hypothetical protein
MSPALESTDAKNKLEDLSGIKVKPGENPYKALIEACNDEPVSVVVFFFCFPPPPSSMTGLEWHSFIRHWTGSAGGCGGTVMGEGITLRACSTA